MSTPHDSDAEQFQQDCIKRVEVVEYEKLGMDAVCKIEVEDFPAFIVVDDKGSEFFADVNKPIALTISRRPDLDSAPGEVPSTAGIGPLPGPGGRVHP